MNRLHKTITSIVPQYSAFPLIFAFVFNSAVYGGARLIAGGWKHYNFESGIDRMIPFVPQTLVIYLGCYLFWAVNYVLIAGQDKKSSYQFFTADLLSRCICFCFFLLLPTTNVRPELAQSGFWNEAMKLLYTVDAADNLFPSIHCLVSWFCFIGVRRQKWIPLWYKGLSCILAMLVFVSTLTTKQHVIIDVAGGMLLAEICFWICGHTKWYLCYERIGDRIEARLFERKRGQAYADKEKSSL